MADVEGYPVRFEVDYPERLDRLSSALRIFWVIPIAIVYGALAPSTFETPGDGQAAVFIAGAGGGVLFFPVLLMLLFRRKYPRWWFDWNREFTRFGARVTSYVLLLRDEYPSTDEEQAIHLEIDPPEAERLNRWLPLVKWLLAIPHYIVLVFMGIAVFFAVIGAWFAILFTGRYPRVLFYFAVGVERWGYRVSAYAFLLTTDAYPPFSLQGERPRGAGGTRGGAERAL